MQRPDWKIAGAAGLAIGVTIGGFSLVSAGGLDRAVRNIEIQGERVQATDGGLMLVDDISSSRAEPAAPPPPPSDPLSASASDGVASPDSTHSVSASLDSPEATAAARTAAPAPSSSADTSASVASIDSVDSADSSD